MIIDHSVQLLLLGLDHIAHIPEDSCKLLQGAYMVVTGAYMLMAHQ